MTLTHYFLTIRYPLVQKGQCLAQGWSTPSHSLNYSTHTPLWCKSRFQSLTGNMSLSFFPSQPIQFPVSGGSPLTVLLLLCFPLECDSVRGWVSVFVWYLHIRVFGFTSEYTFELLCIPMCVCCGSLCVFIEVCVYTLANTHTHTHTGAHSAPLIC